MSAISDRRPQPSVIARRPNSDVATADLKPDSQLMDFIAASAMPVAVVLVIMWVAAVGLVVLRDFVSLKLMTYII